MNQLRTRWDKVSPEFINDLKNIQGFDAVAAMEDILVKEMEDGIKRERRRKTREEKINSILNHEE